MVLLLSLIHIFRLLLASVSFIQFLFNYKFWNFVYCSFLSYWNYCWLLVFNSLSFLFDFLRCLPLKGPHQYSVYTSCLLYTSVQWHIFLPMTMAHAFYRNTQLCHCWWRSKHVTKVCNSNVLEVIISLNGKWHFKELFEATL